MGRGRRTAASRGCERTGLAPATPAACFDARARRRLRRHDDAASARSCRSNLDALSGSGIPVLGLAMLAAAFVCVAALLLVRRRGKTKTTVQAGPTVDALADLAGREKFLATLAGSARGARGGRPPARASPRRHRPLPPRQRHARRGAGRPVPAQRCRAAPRPGRRTRTGWRASATTNSPSPAGDRRRTARRDLRPPHRGHAEGRLRPDSAPRPPGRQHRRRRRAGARAGRRRPAAQRLAGAARRQESRRRHVPPLCARDGDGHRDPPPDGEDAERGPAPGLVRAALPAAIRPPLAPAHRLRGAGAHEPSGRAASCSPTRSCRRPSRAGSSSRSASGSCAKR